MCGSRPNGNGSPVLTEKRNVLQSNILVPFRAHSFASPRLPYFFYTSAPSLTSRSVIHGADGCLYPLAVLFLIFFIFSSAVIPRARCQTSSIYCLSVLYALQGPFRQVTPSRATPFLSIHRFKTLIQLIRGIVELQSLKAGPGRPKAPISR